MESQKIFPTLTLLVMFVLAACGGAPASDLMLDKTEEPAMTEVMESHETPAAEGTMDDKTATPEVMLEGPAWYAAALTDVRTGQVFTINDFKGKVVLVETMAVWCSTCYRQQEQIRAYHNLLGGRGDLVSLSIDIDPNENADVLKNYLGRTGFDWLYAITPADMTREIASLYGDQFLNPPSAPIFIIDRHGVAHPLPFGVKSADDLMKSIQPYLDESL